MVHPVNSSAPVRPQRYTVRARTEIGRRQRPPRPAWPAHSCAPGRSASRRSPSPARPTSLGQAIDGARRCLAPRPRRPRSPPSSAQRLDDDLGVGLVHIVLVVDNVVEPLALLVSARPGPTCGCRASRRQQSRRPTARTETPIKPHSSGRLSLSWRQRQADVGKDRVQRIRRWHCPSPSDSGRPMIPADRRQNGQDHQRHDHDRRRLVDVPFRLFVHARLAVEGDKQQAEGVKSGQPGGDDAQQPQRQCPRSHRAPYRISSLLKKPESSGTPDSASTPTRKVAKVQGIFLAQAAHLENVQLARPGRASRCRRTGRAAP